MVYSEFSVKDEDFYSNLVSLAVGDGGNEEDFHSDRPNSGNAFSKPEKSFEELNDDLFSTILKPKPHRSRNLTTTGNAKLEKGVEDSAKSSVSISVDAKVGKNDVTSSKRGGLPNYTTEFEKNGSFGAKPIESSTIIVPKTVDVALGSYVPTTNSSSSVIPRRRGIISHFTDDTAIHGAESRPKSSYSNTSLEPERDVPSRVTTSAGQVSGRRPSVMDDWLGLMQDEPTRESGELPASIKEKGLPNWLSRDPQEQDSQVDYNKTPLIPKTVPQATEMNRRENVARAISQGQQLSSKVVHVPQPLPPNHSAVENLPIITKVTETNKAGHDSLVISELQAQIEVLHMDRKRLQIALNSIQQQYEEEMKTLEHSLRRQMDVIEESYKRRESRYQTDMEELQRDLHRRQQSWDAERSELIASSSKRVKEVEMTHAQDVERLQDLHRRMLTDMNREQEESIARLQKLQLHQKETQSNSVPFLDHCLKEIVRQYENHTSDLGKVLDILNHQTNTARSFHHEEKKIQEHAQKHDEEKIRLKTEWKKLDNERSLFSEEKKWFMAHMEQQRDLLLQTERERTSIVKDCSDSLETMKQSLAEAQISAVTKSLQEQSEEVDRRVKELHAESEALLSERLALQRQRQELEEERGHLETWAKHLRQLAEETDMTHKMALQTKQEGLSALRSAEELWEEFRHQSYKLKTQEMKLAKEQAAFSRGKERVPLFDVPKTSIDHVSSSLANPVEKYLSPASEDDDTSAWFIAASNDRKFLEREQMFLRSLQATPYHKNYPS